MQECTRQKTKTVNLGRLPIWCGKFKGTDPEDQYDPAVGYHKYNIVTYLGSSFINLVEGNQRDPIDVVYDSSGNIESYSLFDGTDQWTGWHFVANALDAMYWAKRCEKMVNDNFFALEILNIGEDHDGFTAGDIVASYALEGNIEDVKTDGFDQNTGTMLQSGTGKIILNVAPPSN